MKLKTKREEKMKRDTKQNKQERGKEYKSKKKIK